MPSRPIDGVTAVFFPRALVNAFLVMADVPTLIDTGTPGGEKKILAAIRAAGLQAGDVGRILLTHRHADHAGNAAALAHATGAELHVSPVDAPFVTEGQEQPRPRSATPLGQALVPYVKRALPWSLDRAEARPTLAEEATIGPFRVVGSPGHTAGHVSLLWEERGVLFAGDAAANITRVGPHPASDDPQRALLSFRALGDLDFDAACFGHGRSIASGARTRFRAASRA